ncbi:hypothetical protein HY384_03190 [Candidatus Daviesbacteria bacterium]|nr:hypothetical protein [Candidatus Daviesbacteria bacterium]
MDDQNNPSNQGGVPSEPAAPMGDTNTPPESSESNQPMPESSQQKCVTCGNAAESGNCMSCGKGEASCSCTPMTGGPGPSSESQGGGAAPVV